MSLTRLSPASLVTWPLRVWHWFQNPIRTEIEAEKILKGVWTFYIAVLCLLVFGYATLLIWAKQKMISVDPKKPIDYSSGASFFHCALDSDAEKPRVSCFWPPLLRHELDHVTPKVVGIAGSNFSRDAFAFRQPRCTSTCRCDGHCFHHGGSYVQRGTGNICLSLDTPLKNNLEACRNCRKCISDCISFDLFVGIHAVASPDTLVELAPHPKRAAFDKRDGYYIREQSFLAESIPTDTARSSRDNGVILSRIMQRG